MDEEAKQIRPSIVETKLSYSDRRTQLASSLLATLVGVKCLPR